MIFWLGHRSSVSFGSAGALAKTLSRPLVPDLFAVG